MRNGITLQILLLLMLCGLFANCATTRSVRVHADLQQGKRYFETGYYKRALHQLLPPACDGNADAQYAVGYLYYYGYGVAQDTDVGYFWIRRSAIQGYPPAIAAMRLISKDNSLFRQKNKMG